MPVHHAAVFFFIRLLRWKWNYDKKLTGFVPDIVEILVNYDLLEVLMTYILTNDFPTKTLWKKTVNKHAQVHKMIVNYCGTG